MPIKLVFLAFLDTSLGTSDALIFFVGLSLIVLCYLYEFLYPRYRSPKGEGGEGILFYLCPSVQDIFFVAFFSVTIDGRNLIFGHKHHIGIPYCG
jgi:hypothetical protein